MLSKKNNIFCDFAKAILLSYFSEKETITISGVVNTSIDEGLCMYKPDYIISFLSPWVIPKTLLNSAKIAAINFHPGSPDYPGTGCYNFAIYEKAIKYGITCHHMNEKVDTGDIIKVRYFDMAPNESVESLKLKSMNHMLLCFTEIIEMIYNNQDLPASQEKWKRKAFTRKQLDELCQIDLKNDDENEINLKIRATYYPGAKGPYVRINNNNFILQADGREPII